MSTSSLERERAGALERRQAKNLDRYWPAWLLRQVDPGASRAALEEAARERWPSLDDERLERVVRGAQRLQEEQRGRRIDPADVKLAHPQRRERLMTSPTATRLRTWIREQLDAEPGLTNDQLERRAEKEFSGVTRRSLGQNAGMVRRELEAAANGAAPKADPKPTDEDHQDDEVRPEPPSGSPSAGEAEPETAAPMAPAPATDPVEGTVTAAENRGSLFSPTRSTASWRTSEAATRVGGDMAPQEDDVDVPEILIERSRRTPGRMDVRLSLTGVSPAVALRVGAALASAVELELRQTAA